MIKNGRSVLLLVDIQPDFMPGGALPVEEGDQIVTPIRHLMEAAKFDHYVATQDWHPAGHVSFASSHAGAEPLQTIELYDHEQALWPDHCVQGTAGAELHEGLPWERVAAIIRKGNDPAVDSYSGFRNNWNPDGKRPPTGLAGYLRERGIEKVYLCGLARDICVKFSAVDAADGGFRTYFVWDLTRAVAPSSDDTVRHELAERNVSVIMSDEL